MQAVCALRDVGTQFVCVTLMGELPAQVTCLFISLYWAVSFVVSNINLLEWGFKFKRVLEYCDSVCLKVMAK
jgi:hypothetical protein